MFENLTEKIAWAIATIKDDRDLDKGITDVELAKILRTNKDTLAGYRRGEGLLKGEVIDRLVSHYNFNPMWLFKGYGEPFPGARAKYPEVCGPEPPAQTSGVSLDAILTSQDSPDDEFVFIGRVHGKISAGGGLAPDDDVDVQLAFRRDWIKKKGSPGNMSLIKVAGDSMAPTLLSGDLVLVDHSRISVAPQGGIYAVAIDHEIMIKRIQVLFPTNKLKIISDNKRYEPIEADPDQVKINGKVIWFGRDLER